MRLVPTLLLASMPLACGSRSGLFEPSPVLTDAGVAGSGGAGPDSGSGGGGAGAGAAPPCASASDPLVLAQGIPSAHGIAMDATHLFVTSAVDGGAVVRIPKSGGAMLTLQSGLGRPRHLALSSDRVWVTSPMDGRVLSFAKDGSDTQVIVAPSPGHPEGIDTTSGAIFWVRGGPGVKNGALFAVQPPAEPLQLAVGLDSPWALAVDGGEAFWIDNSSGSTPAIWRYVPATTAAPQLVTPLPAANGNDLDLDGTHVYYALNAEVGRVPRSGGPRQALATGVFAHGIALAGPHLYWVEGGATTAGRLARIPRAGGSDETLATGFEVPRGVVVDEACVFWTNQGVGEDGGSVMARAR